MLRQDISEVSKSKTVVIQKEGLRKLNHKQVSPNPLNVKSKHTSWKTDKNRITGNVLVGLIEETTIILNYQR